MQASIRMKIAGTAALATQASSLPHGIKVLWLSWHSTAVSVRAQVREPGTPSSGSRGDGTAPSARSAPLEALSEASAQCPAGDLQKLVLLCKFFFLFGASTRELGHWGPEELSVEALEAQGLPGVGVLRDQTVWCWRRLYLLVTITWLRLQHFGQDLLVLCQ